MFKRLFWYGSGVASGVAGTWWTRRKVRKQMERYTPKGMKEQARHRANQARSDAAVAVSDGRQRLRRYRSDFDARRRRGHIHAVPDPERTGTPSTRTS